MTTKIRVEQIQSPGIASREVMVADGADNVAWDILEASDVGAGAALTKSDDTNVTLTLGGSPTVALLAATSLTLGWTGQLSASRGGTGVDNTGHNLTIPETGTAALLGAANIFTATQKIDVNSATAFVVEQDGVNNNVLVVDTATPLVSIIAGLDLTGTLEFQGAQSITTTAGDITIDPAGDTHILGQVVTGEVLSISTMGIHTKYLSSDTAFSRGIYSEHVATTTTDGAWHVYSLAGLLEATVDTGMTNSGSAMALNGSVQKTGDGALSNLIGIYGNARIYAGTLTSMYGIYALTGSSGGTVDNVYGLFVPNVSVGATLNYAIYTNAGVVHFGDYVEAIEGVHIGGTSDPGTDNLIVDGTSLLTGTVTLGPDASNYMTIAVGANGLTSFTTVDATGAEADIVFVPDGDVIFNANNVLISRSTNEQVGLGLDPLGTTGSANFYRNLAAVDTNCPVVLMRQTNVGDDQPVLILDQDGTGDILQALLGASVVFTILNDGGLATLGGVHVGGASDPGTDNLSVDGTSLLTGVVTFSSIAAAVVDTDKFLVSDGGVLKFRTGAEVLSDIGAGGSGVGPGTAGRVAQFGSGGTTVEDSNIVPPANLLTLIAGGAYTFTIPATGTAALLATANVFTAVQKIDVNSATAFVVEQDGVYDDVLVVDTATNVVETGGTLSFTGIGSIITEDGDLTLAPALDVEVSTNLNATGYITAIGGMHVGGVDDPGDSDLIVDQDATFGFSNGDAPQRFVIRADNSATSSTAPWIRYSSTGNLIINSGSAGFLKLQSDVTSQYVLISSYLATVGGVHVGGTTDPGTDNLIVDGTSLFTGFVTASGTLKVAGEIRQGATDYGAYEIQTVGQIYCNDYGMFIGGLHVGGTSDPSTDNLIVDGTSILTGNVGLGVTPEVHLHLEKTNDTGNTNIPTFRFTDADTASATDQVIGRIEFETRDSAAPGIGSYIQGVATDTSGNTHLSFATGAGNNPLERVTISSIGNLVVENASARGNRYISINRGSTPSDAACFAVGESGSYNWYIGHMYNAGSQTPNLYIGESHEIKNSSAVLVKTPILSMTTGAGTAAGKVGVGIILPLGKLHVDQPSTTGIIPVLTLDQADISQEYIDFISAATTAGYPIDTATAVGTVYARLRVAVNGTFKYIQLYNA